MMTDEKISDIFTAETGFFIKDSPEALLDFARAIEAKTREADEALLRQALEAMANAPILLFTIEEELPHNAAMGAIRARLAKPGEAG